MKTGTLLTAMIAIGLPALQAQDAATDTAMTRRDGGVVRGEIAASPASFGIWTVELASSSGGMNVASAVVDPDGTFEFRSVVPGMYSLRISDAYGASIHQEFVNITNSGQRLTIRLDGRPNANRTATTGPATISLRELQHKTPPKALKAFSKGHDASEKGRNQEAVDFYREAIAVDPEYVAAYVELACAEAALGQFPDSAVQFQKVIDMVPTQRDALVNLPIVLAKMRRYHEAGQVARRTLDLYPDAAKVHFVLAASLLSENGDLAEALDHLQKAALEVPKAHLVAADVLTNLGRKEDAAGHLEQYLKSLPSDGADRPAIEARLATMRQ